MESPAQTIDFAHLQDVLGSFPMIKRYIVIGLAFSTTDDTSATRVETMLADSLKRLAEAFPFLAGQVIYEGRDETHTGIQKIVSLEGRIQLIMNDLQNSDFPSMNAMAKAKFPFSMLDPDTLLPPIAVSWSTDGFDKVAPVLILQANIIKGGILITFSGNHTTMDMSGLGMIISLFSKACRNEPYTAEEISQGNQSRKNAIPLYDDPYDPGNVLDDAWTPPPNQTLLNAVLNSNPRWAYFNFRANNLSRLKASATDIALVPYISTDDAVAALMWQRITHARLATLGTNTTSTFCRPLSVRKYLGLKGYLGHMVDCAYTSHEAAHTAPLSTIAASLRQMLLKEEEIVEHTRAFATVLDKLDDKSKLINGAKLDALRDVVVSSHSNTKLCELEFGELGRAVCARRPRMPPWAGLVYLMPKDELGDMAVGVCLEEEVVGRLRVDQVLGEYAEWVG